MAHLSVTIGAIDESRRTLRAVAGVGEAERVAYGLLAAEFPERWAHVAGVAERARQTTAQLEGIPGELFVTSAWLHDIGYAVEALDTGFHPLDGARFLRSEGFPDVVSSLVAHHSCAEVEANLRGFDRELQEEFPHPEETLRDALCYCDMVTGPTGQRISVEERLVEIRERYGRDHLVAQFIDLAEHELVGAVRRVELRLSSARAG